MKIRIQLLFLALVLGLGGGGFLILKWFKPVPDKQDDEQSAPAVEIIEVQLQPLPVTIGSQGFVEPMIETQLASEVSGRIIEVSDNLRPGARFEEGEVLLRIDPADYRAALAEAKSRLADARLNLEQEQARSEQALRDWQKLGTGEPPSDLVARRPHAASAEASVEAAEAAVARAQNDLDRTEIRAPYSGRVRQVMLDLGGFATAGAPVAEIYSSAPFEVRLPIPLDDLPFLELGGVTEAQLTALVGGTEYTWQAIVVGDEAEFDRSTRSLFLIAEVTPGTRSQDAQMLKPGLFVQAAIPGRALENAVALPQRAFDGPDTVIVARPDDTIELRPVAVARQEDGKRLVTSGLAAGDRVVVSPLATVVEGMTVRIAESDADGAQADGE